MRDCFNRQLEPENTLCAIQLKVRYGKLNKKSYFPSARQEIIFGPSLKTCLNKNLSQKHRLKYLLS